MRPRSLWLAVIPAFVAGAACTHAETPTHQPAPARAVTISIFATNDVHGQLERLTYLGGFVSNLRKAREGNGGVLLVDAGDAFQGTLASNANEGAAIVAAYDALGYSAMALGNHEFDFGPAGPASAPMRPGDDPRGALQQRIDEAHFPILSANLVGDDGTPTPLRHLASSTEVVVDGVRIGVIGLLTEDAPDVIKRTVFAGLHVDPLAFAAAREAVALRTRGVDLVVVVAHAGGQCARGFDTPNDLSSCDTNSEIFRLARALPPGMVDVIVGGHRNAAVSHVVRGIPIVHAPSNLLAFSRVDLVYDTAAHRVREQRVFAPHAVCTLPLEQGCVPGVYEGKAVTPSAAVAAAVAPALAAARELEGRPLGVTVTAPFTVQKGGETALANLFADLLREAAPGVDAAISNAGSVRDALPEGELTFGRLHHVMPFDNQLASVVLTGNELRAVVAANVTSEHGLMALSGLTVEVRCQGGTLVVDVKRPGGAPVRDDETLRVVTSDFLALGGDGLFAAARIPPAQVALDLGTAMRDALTTGLRKRRSVDPNDPALFEPGHPRITLPSPLPVRCHP